MKKQHFSLVELLVVIGIIVLLAGLMIPAVMSSKTKGQITEAKADMAAIKMALKGMERDYKTMLKVKSNGDVDGGKINLTAKKETLKAKGSSKNVDMAVVTYDNNEKDEYNALIMELSDPREVSNSDKNINKRNIKYLDPRPDYAVGEEDTLWRDPWGNPYCINIDTKFSGTVFLEIPSDVVAKPKNVDSAEKYMLIRDNVAVYSWGPNGEDDGSFNAENGGKSTMDDIRGWEK